MAADAADAATTAASASAAAADSDAPRPAGRLAAWHPRALLARHGVLNPMIFKELTQGIRNNGFIALFFILLALAWGTVLTVAIIARADPSFDGHSTAVTLLAVLYLFGLIVGTRAFGLTVKEVDNRTFELYMLAGMSPEKLVRGKIATCAYLFLFGFFTVVPFVFSGYFLSGLDFFVMLWVLAFMLVALNAYYVFSILMALIRSLTSARTIVSLAYYAAVFAMFWLGVVFLFMGRGGLQDFADEMRELFSFGTVDAYYAVGALTIFYAEALLLAFYWACHIVCPESDSREHCIKLHLTILMGALLALMFIDPKEQFSIFIAGLYGLAILALGVMFWINREDVPVIVGHRIVYGSWLERRFFWLFEPGMRGSGRLILLLTVLGAACGWASAKQLGISADRQQFLLNLWALPGAYLFQLVVWRGVFDRIRGLRHNPALLRTTLVVFWSIAAFAAWMIQIIYFPNTVAWNHLPVVGILIGWLVTPFVTLYVVASSPYAYFLHIVSGTFGLMAAYFMLRAGARARVALPEREDDAPAPVAVEGVAAVVNEPPPPAREENVALSQAEAAS